MKITGIINIMFRPQKTLKKTRIKLYNTLELRAVIYGSGNLTIKGRDARRITAAQMKHMRKTTGYTWTDYKTNTEKEKNEILKNAGIQQKLITTYKQNAP
jgi:ABC-type ATPase involved in cell division